MQQELFDDHLEPNLALWPYEIPILEIAARIIYLGAPLGKQRPRFNNRGQVYTPTQTRAYEGSLRALFLEQTRFAPADHESCFALRCRFYRPNRQRIDCDNLVKAISDAATGVVWKDDSQVQEVFARLILASPNPRAEVIIHRINNPSPKPKCEFCGKSIVVYPSIGTRFCSRECDLSAKRVTLICPECGHSFTLGKMEVKRRLQKRSLIFCSRNCCVRNARKTSPRKRFKPESNQEKWKCVRCAAQLDNPNWLRCAKCRGWKCRICDGPVSRREYVRCNACRLEGRVQTSESPSAF